MEFYENQEDKNPVCECRRDDCPLCGANGWPDPEECPFCAEGACPEHGWSFNDSRPDGADYQPVTLEAHGLVFGDRGVDYGHPLSDFSRTAAFWTAYLEHKLRPGATVEAEDVGPLMMLLKISRQVNVRKRDNLVDAAGYAETTQRVIAERARLQRIKDRTK